MCSEANIQSNSDRTTNWLYSDGNRKNDRTTALLSCGLQNMPGPAHPLGTAASEAQCPGSPKLVIEMGRMCKNCDRPMGLFGIPEYLFPGKAWQSHVEFGTDPSQISPVLAVNKNRDHLKLFIVRVRFCGTNPNFQYMFKKMFKKMFHFFLSILQKDGKKSLCSIILLKEMFHFFLFQSIYSTAVQKDAPSCNRHLSSRLHHVRMLLQHMVMARAKDWNMRSWIWSGPRTIYSMTFYSEIHDLLSIYDPWLEKRLVTHTRTKNHGKGLKNFDPPGQARQGQGYVFRQRGSIPVTVIIWLWFKLIYLYSKLPHQMPFTWLKVGTVSLDSVSN